LGVAFRFLYRTRTNLGQLGAFDAAITFSHAPLGDTALAKQYRASLAYAVRPGGYLILRESPEPMHDLTGPGRDFEMLEPGLFCRLR
jgi:hypothetical protein